MRPPQDPRLVYLRTPDGEAEMLGRGVPLPPAARRILMVIDGRRRVGDLPDFARGGELAEVLDLLLSRGLIALAGIAEAPSDAEQRAQAAREAVLLSSLKKVLANVFERTLDGSGTVLDARISDSVSLSLLKRVLREGIDQVAERRGDAAAKAIIARVRPLFAVRQAEVDQAAAARALARPGSTQR